MHLEVQVVQVLSPEEVSVVPTLLGSPLTHHLSHPITPCPNLLPCDIWGERLICRLNALGATGLPVVGSTTGVPIMSPAPRRDSIEFRGRASTNASANGGEMLPPAQVPIGLERVLESLKHENGEYKKAIRELDDRCNPPQKASLKVLWLINC